MGMNLQEIFETAIQIEKSGYNFYKEAASKIPEHSEFLTFLANEEIGHEMVFKGLQEVSVSKEMIENFWNPDNIMTQYFEAMAESLVFRKSDKEINELFEAKNILDVIDWAIKREQDSVLYFTGLRESLKNSEEKSKIEAIISEEISHIHILMDKKSKLI